MKHLLLIDPETDTEEESIDAVKLIFSKSKKPSQRQLETENTTDNSENDIVVVVRDGDEKTTESVKEELKQKGFNYFKFKKGTKKEDPRWTQICSKNYWNEIKDHSIFQGLKVWTSKGGGQ